MISELNREHCWALRQNDSCPALVAYLNKITYSSQLKSLIELSEACRDALKIYVTKDITLKVINGGQKIQGTPTYILVQNGTEQDRMLGESDTLRLQHFVALYIDKTASMSSRQRDADAETGRICGCNSST